MSINVISAYFQLSSLDSSSLLQSTYIYLTCWSVLSAGVERTANILCRIDSRGEKMDPVMLHESNLILTLRYSVSLPPVKQIVSGPPKFCHNVFYKLSYRLAISAGIWCTRVSRVNSHVTLYHKYTCSDGKSNYVWTKFHLKLHT